MNHLPLFGRRALSGLKLTRSSSFPAFSLLPTTTISAPQAPVFHHQEAEPGCIPFYRSFSKKSSNVQIENFSLDIPKGLMDKAVEHLRGELTGIRSGRASPGMLDSLQVTAYGEKMPLTAVGTVSVRDPQLLSVTVFDPDTAENVVKAIRESPLQLNPVAEGSVVLVPIPSLTKESLEGMARLVRKEAEKCKVSLRHARKVGLEQAHALPSEDDRKRAEKEVQKLTDAFIADVDKIRIAKEKDLVQA